MDEETRKWHAQVQEALRLFRVDDGTRFTEANPPELNVPEIPLDPSYAFPDDMRDKFRDSTAFDLRETRFPRHDFRRHVWNAKSRFGIWPSTQLETQLQESWEPLMIPVQETLREKLGATEGLWLQQGSGYTESEAKVLSLGDLYLCPTVQIRLPNNFRNITDLVGMKNLSDAALIMGDITKAFFDILVTLEKEKNIYLTNERGKKLPLSCLIEPLFVLKDVFPGGKELSWRCTARFVFTRTWDRRSGHLILHDRRVPSEAEAIYHLYEERR